MQWLLDGSIDLRAIKAEIRRIFELAFSRSDAGESSAKITEVNG
jgi:hypothetical protein